MIFDDSDFEAWQASIMTHPILGDEFTRMVALSAVLRRHPIAGSRDPRNWYGRHYQEVFGPSRYSAEQVHRSAKLAAARCRYEDQHLLNGFLSPLERNLRGESRVTNTYDPIELLGIWSSSVGSDPISRQARAEAMIRFIMARRLQHIDETESEIDVGEQEARVIRDLTGRMFVPGASENLLVRAILDRNNGYRIASWRMVKSEADPFTPEEELAAQALLVAVPDEQRFILRHELMPSRVMRFGDGERLIFVDDRVKSDFVSCLKEIRKGRPMSEEVDKRGVHLVAYDDDSLFALQEYVERELIRSPFGIHKRFENLTRDEPLKGNGHGSSSKEFKVIRYELKYDDRDASGLVLNVELNLRRAGDFLNDAVSLSPSRHEVYRYDQLRGGYFPFRFPGFLHGVDWSLNSDHDRRIRDCLDLGRLSAVLGGRRVVLPG